MASKLTVALSSSLHYLVEYLCLYSTAVGGSNLLLSLALVQGSARLGAFLLRTYTFVPVL